MKELIHTTIQSKIEKEKSIVAKMILLYCKGLKHEGGSPCKDCHELISYASLRIEKCPMMKTKTFCSNCKIHCYKPFMREKIKKVMRYSGPRLLLSHPIMTIGHLIEQVKEKV